VLGEKQPPVSVFTQMSLIFPVRENRLSASDSEKNLMFYILFIGCLFKEVLNLRRRILDDG
jgi:hypothetical protein